MSRRAGLLILTCGTAAIALGCRGTELPNVFHPPTTPQEVKAEQRRQERFDPYPENNLGPVVEGVRPRSFDQPWPEPADARWHYPNGRPPQP